GLVVDDEDAQWLPVGARQPSALGRLGRDHASSLRGGAEAHLPISCEPAVKARLPPVALTTSPACAPIAAAGR
ncbi:MAG: hypothetical protein ACRDO2_08395, partial [Nocardioidaceae bacterium]